MNLYQVPYRFSAAGEEFSMFVRADSVSEAGSKVLRALPNAIVWGFPKLQSAVAHANEQWGNYASSRARAHARFHEREVIEGNAR
jgi:hypothetical protein